MNLRRLLSALCLGILACGCAANKALPVNSRESPLFHDSTYMAMGVGLGTWTGTGQFLELSHMSKNLLLQLEAPVTSWASFNGLPVNWNFLLTGRQYDDSGRLAEGMFHSVFSLGPTGVAYSSAAGWSMPAEAQLRMKRLFGNRWFWNGSLEYAMSDILESTQGAGSVAMGFHYQTSLNLALGVSTCWNRYFLEPGYSMESLGGFYLDGSHRWITSLGLEWLPTPHYILRMGVGHGQGVPVRGPREQMILSGSFQYAF